MTTKLALKGVRLPPPTATRVREVFDYDPETGVLRWLARAA